MIYEVRSILCVTYIFISKFFISGLTDCIKLTCKNILATSIEFINIIKFVYGETLKCLGLVC